MSKMGILKNYEGTGSRHGGAERITPSLVFSLFIGWAIKIKTKNTHYN